MQVVLKQVDKHACVSHAVYCMKANSEMKACSEVYECAHVVYNDFFFFLFTMVWGYVMVAFRGNPRKSPLIAYHLVDTFQLFIFLTNSSRTCKQRI